MGCTNCGTGAKKGGCKSNGNCATGCGALSTHNWFADRVEPNGVENIKLVEVQYKSTHKEFVYNNNNVALKTGDRIYIKKQYGYDIGAVTLTGELAKMQFDKKNVYSRKQEEYPEIQKLASENEIEKLVELRKKEPEIIRKAKAIAVSEGLKMKISDCQYSGDGKRMIVYYTADERVDFRNLIRQFAQDFNARIEMKQISHRHEAARVGGIGSCGRELCCSTWLTDFKLVSPKQAKAQNIAINMDKLAGQCGRLKCCLNFELDQYVDAMQTFPKGKRITINTDNGDMKLQKSDILKQTMYFKVPKGDKIIAVEVSKVKEWIAINKNGKVVKLQSSQGIQQELAINAGPVENQDETYELDLDKFTQKHKKQGKNNRFKKRPSRNKKASGNNHSNQKNNPNNKSNVGNKPTNSTPKKRFVKKKKRTQRPE